MKLIAMVPVLVSLLLVAAGHEPAVADNCWDFNEIDPLRTYTLSNAVQVLPNGFEARLWPIQHNVDPEAAAPYTELRDGYLRYKGGERSAQDFVLIGHPLVEVAPGWVMTVRYLHFAGCPEQRILELLGGNIDTLHFWLEIGSACLNNTCMPYSSLDGIWQTAEVIGNGATAEIRIWSDGDARPEAALITAPSIGSPGGVTLWGQTLCAPEVWIDSLCFSPLLSVSKTTSTWSHMKGRYR